MEDNSMEFGKRLLPQIVDYYAQTQSDRVYASIPKSSTDLSKGFQDVTMAHLASIVNSLSWWLSGTLGVGSLNTIAYIGPADIRYAAVFLAAVKCRYKVMFISPRNKTAQNQSMLVRAECRTLFYAEELAPAAGLLKDNLSYLVTKSFLSLDEILQTSDNTKHYPFDKSFEELENEPCLILHSSGSTGDPKLVTMTHGTFAVTDNDRNMPVPDGRRPRNAAQYNFQRGGRFYSCFPPYHLAGVQSYIALPIFTTSATVVFGPTKLPPSGALLSEIQKHQHLRALFVPPSIIEQWMMRPEASEQAKRLDFVLYGGGPLSPSVGDRLSKVADVCQAYGSLEVGQVQLLVPQAGEWSYLELNPFGEADMQDAGDGTFEMVFHQNPKFATHRSVWHNFPDIETWRTRDLFVPHPSKPGLWRFHSRVDDLIVFSSSHKLRPVQMETIIQGNELLSGALIAGQGKPEPLLIVEPKSGVYEGHPGPFIDRIWHSVLEANAIAPTYAQLSRSKILIANSEKPFIRAPKGTVVRKLTIQSYAEDIEAAYSDNLSQAESDDPTIEGIDTFILPGVKQYIRKCVEEFLPGILLLDKDNVFVRGLDSLGATALDRKLRIGLAKQKLSDISLNMIYEHPTIEGLASVIADNMLGRHISGSVQNSAESMKQAVMEFNENMPLKPTGEVVLPSAGLNVVLIGPRGSLGPHIVASLLLNPSVGKVYCLNRGENGLQLLQGAFEARGLPMFTDRVVFMPIVLGEPNLGLSEPNYSDLSKSAHLIIHNAWKVDFNWTLDLYKIEHLRGLRDVVDFAAQGAWRPRIVFISSVSSVQNWDTLYPTPVAEKALEEADDYEISSSLGYGQSKHVSERILTRASVESGIPITILRLGQIAGSTSVAGVPWSENEWIPSVAATAKILRLIPNGLPFIDWIPVDVMAEIVCELALPQQEKEQKCHLRDQGRASEQLRVFNVVNPHLADWALFVDVLRERLGVAAQLVSLPEWVDSLQRVDTRTMSQKEISVITKTSPFFQHLASRAVGGIAMQPKYETDNGVRASRAMAQLQAVDKTLIRRWCQQWGI